MQIVVYEGYTIKSFPQQNLMSEQWMVSVEISRVHDGIPIVKTFQPDSAYASEEDADVYGVTYAHDIIDGRIDGLPLP